MDFEDELDALAEAREIIEEVRDSRREKDLRNSGGYMNAIITLIDSAQRRLTAHPSSLDGVPAFTPSDEEEDTEEDYDEDEEDDWAEDDEEEDDESYVPPSTGVVQSTQAQPGQ